jgi:2-amino-4-hydroxy-6-hydroxymethyldihydropteridine diphosphokinase
VIAAQASLEPLSFYRYLYAIEKEFGRIRTYKFARRTIDLDLLLSLDITFNGTNFFLPHQEAFKRMFFVVPAIEALQSAGWPIPLRLIKRRAAGGPWYLRPVAKRL